MLLPLRVEAPPRGTIPRLSLCRDIGPLEGVLSHPLVREPEPLDGVPDRPPRAVKYTPWASVYEASVLVS